ncbi:MAG: penicillin acylase family protein, partial [Pseudomonadota bacterium]
VAFGLAYAHAEDDWATIEDVVLFSRGTLAEKIGRDGAVTDFLVAALGAWPAIDAKYERDLEPKTRALLKAYADGLNLYCAEEKSRCRAGVAPLTPEDIVAGFVTRIPFFYGLDDTLTPLFEGDEKKLAAAANARHAVLKIEPGVEIGSNAMAIAPSRSADGHTRLMVNSHQPFTGPVAWYEARVKSEEGWDMMGALFPGAPMILHGAGPDLGWAFTVNKPDVVDIFTLEVDDEKDPKRYKFNGEWKAFEFSEARFRVKLFGPFSLPVKRTLRRSVHGPAFETPTGFYAVSFAGDGEVDAVEQYYKMNRATTFDAWKDAMAMQAIPSFNVVYADKAGNIGYFYNAAIPDRAAGRDWRTIAPGDRADLVWSGVRPFGAAPRVENPSSGYVVNANHSPFKASAAEDNPDPADFPPHYGIDTRTTNRGLRIQALYGGDASITGAEFVAYKMDTRYAEDSRLMRLAKALANNAEAAADPDLAEALALLASWSGSTEVGDRSAALAVRTGHLALGYLLEGKDAEEPDPVAALRRASAELKRGFGRIDPEWGEVNRLKRGDVDLPLNGGPDILRAIYGAGDPGDGALTAVGGDTSILYADWPADGPPIIKTVHQFG